MDDSPDTELEQPSSDTPTLCACGCGEAVTPGKVWVRGHHRCGRVREPDDQTLVALTPADMATAQHDLLAWCDAKVAAVRQELADLQTNLELATEHGWKRESVAAALSRCEKRVRYYEKLKAAVDAGYLIVPNFPIDVFAVRVRRAKPTAKVHDSAWSSNFRATPELLPVGEGRYVDDQVSYRDESYSENLPDGRGGTKTTEVRRYIVDEFKEVGFPVVAVKPAILSAATRAMALRIFDEVGTVRNEAGRDPIVVGRILDGTRHNRRAVTFFIAWWLETASL
jgi:hypothetical protein